MESLTDDVLIQLFLRFTDPKSLANCSLVCRRWATTLGPISSFWITKCKFDGRTIPNALLANNLRADLRKRLDYRIIWLKNPYGRNLIKNDSGQERFKYWQIDPPMWDRSYPQEGFDDSEDSGGLINHFFQTCHFDCEKTQIIDLCAEGVQPWILDILKPTIVVSEWHGTFSRNFDASVYQIKVMLMNKSWHSWKQYLVPDNCLFTDECIAPQLNGKQWVQTMHKFENYPVGVRYVSFTSSSKHVERGGILFYGSRMAKASVILQFNPEMQLPEPESARCVIL